jgi:hypothetical protein
MGDSEDASAFFSTCVQELSRMRYSIAAPVEAAASVYRDEPQTSGDIWSKDQAARRESQSLMLRYEDEDEDEVGRSKHVHFTGIEFRGNRKRDLKHTLPNVHWLPPRHVAIQRTHRLVPDSHFALAAVNGSDWPKADGGAWRQYVRERRTLDKNAASIAAAEAAAAEEAAAGEKAAAEKAATKKAAATWQPRYMAVAEGLASSSPNWRLPPPAAIPTSSARAPRRREEGQHSANEDPRRGGFRQLEDGRLSPILGRELAQNGDVLEGVEAAAKKAAAQKLAAEKAAAEKAAAEKAATEQAPPREWWQPPDWMGVTAKPSGDAAKAEAEKAEAAEAAAAAARSPSPLANGTPCRPYNLGSPLANGTPGRAYNLGGYKAPPPSRTKAELEANLESERQKGRPRPSTTLRLPLSPEPWLGGGSVSPERSEQARSRRLQSKSTWLAPRSDRAESSRPTTGTKALGEPSYWSALGWRSWRES